jgi:hypothetical protein
VLAGVFVAVLIALLVVTGQDNEPDASLASIRSSYDQSHAVIAWTSYAAMAACSVLVFLGAGLRAALRGARAPWTADVALLGFVAIAFTLAGWTVSDLAMWQAVDGGEDSAIRALNYLDTSSFLPLMVGMACAMIGTGLAGLTSGTLPRWLATASVVLGCLAPLGPLGFVPTTLLPVWILVVAVFVRTESGERA